MLLRTDDRGVLAIGQQSHAWISGQLARAWGNVRFGPVEPHEEVCLGAEQHDIGMAGWDLAPTLNPDTGLPHSFIEMPLEVHLELWSAGPRRLLAQSRYAALLASMHGARLYEQRDLNKLTPAQAGAVHGFLHEQREFQDGLLASLRADSVTAVVAGADLVARNGQLVWIWDFLSLAVCLNWAPCAAHGVPTVDDPIELQLSHADQPHTLTLDPWPFATDHVALRCEGRRLSRRCESEPALRDALASAPWETLDFELVPLASQSG